MIGRVTRETRNKGSLAGSAVALGALLLCGCGRPQPPPPRYLQVDIESSPGPSDPRYSTDAISSRINELIFDSLVRVDRNGQFVGDLAESIERINDRALVFHLKPGIRFSDGRLLTSHDVKFTFESIRDPAAASPKSGAIKKLQSIDALDDRTVMMTTSEPYAPALELAMNGIVPEGTPPP